jgi:hypothetical protein
MPAELTMAAAEAATLKSIGRSRNEDDECEHII